MKKIKQKLRNLRKGMLEQLGWLPRHPGRVISPPNASRFDFSLMQHRADGAGFYAEALKKGPVCFEPSWECWVVVGHKQVTEALTRDDWFSNEYTANFDPFLAGSDGDIHRQFRQLMRSLMSAIRQQTIADFVNHWMTQFVDTARQKGRFDAVQDFGIPLPRNLTAATLGLTQPEVDRIVGALSPRRTEMHPALRPVGQVLTDILADLELNPRTGLFSALVHETASDRPTDQQIISLIRLLWFDGTETLSALLPACVVWLCRHPEIAHELVTDPQKIPNFVSEVLRLEPPAQFVPRKCVQDLDFAGFRFSQGALVRLCLASANRDPDVYPEPDTLRWDRIPYRHLAFGSGAHYCLGAMIAKTTAETAVAHLLKAFPTLAPGSPNTNVEYEDSPTFRALHKFDVIVG